MKTHTRLTKKIVREELNDLRKKIAQYCDMEGEALRKEYAQVFPEGAKGNPPEKEMRYSLIASATHYMSLVLGLD